MPPWEVVMAKISRVTTSICLASAVAFCGLAAAVMTTATADETFKLKTIIQPSSGKVIRSFDISFVDPTTHTYALAVSATKPPPAVGTATNPEILLVNTQTKAIIGEFNASPTFAGNCSIPPARDTISGPNGVMIIHKANGAAEIWAGDGPQFATPCNTGTAVSMFSSARVLDLNTGVTKATINLGG